MMFVSGLFHNSLNARDRTVVLGGVMVIVLATGPKVRELKPGRRKWIFKGDKNRQHDFLRRGSKAVGPMS
jgi:hypothetical protein